MAENRSLSLCQSTLTSPLLRTASTVLQTRSADHLSINRQRLHCDPALNYGTNMLENAQRTKNKPFKKCPHASADKPTSCGSPHVSTTAQMLHLHSLPWHAAAREPGDRLTLKWSVLCALRLPGCALRLLLRQRASLARLRAPLAVDCSRRLRLRCAVLEGAARYACGQGGKPRFANSDTTE